MIKPKYEVRHLESLELVGKWFAILALVLATSAFLLLIVYLGWYLSFIIRRITEGVVHMIMISAIPLLVLNDYFVWGGLCKLWEHIWIEEDGLHVWWPLRKRKILPWSSFQQVCICSDSYFSKSQPTYQICFVRHGEKKNRRGRWKTSFFHYKTVISVYLTPELLAGVRERCPMEIVDLTQPENQEC